MKARFGMALSMVAGAAFGGAAIQALHAQAKPPVYMIAINEVRDQERNVKLEPEPETTGAATRQVDDVKPETKKPKTQTTRQSRTRPARRQQQPDTTHYAQQPSFGGYWPMY